MRAIQRKDLIDKNLHIPAISVRTEKSEFLMIDTPVPYNWYAEERGEVTVVIGAEIYIVDSGDLVFLD